MVEYAHKNTLYILRRTSKGILYTYKKNVHKIIYAELYI